MRVGPSTPIEPAGSPSISNGATTTEQAASCSSPSSDPIADAQAAVEDVADERHDDVLLLEGAEHRADRLDGVEGLGHARDAADVDRFAPHGCR